MRVSGGFNPSISANSINSFFNALGQGQMAAHAARLSRSGGFMSSPGNNAPGAGNAASADAGRFLNSITSASDSLSNVLSQLITSGNRIVAISSNADAVSVQHTGARPQGARSMDVSVHQLARGQVNEGRRMTADDQFQGNAGTHQFAIEAGGISRTLSVNVAQGDTNADVQQRMADAINSANMGFSASVEINTETNSSILRVESNATGASAENAFTIRDVSGDLVSRTGANEMHSAAQNAVFTVDGQQRTSASNTVFIGSGVTVTFNRVTEPDESARISWGRDQSGATEQNVRDMVSSFNDLFSAASGRVNDPRAQNLSSRLLNVVSANSRALSDIGVGMDSSGRLTIDSGRLSRAAESGGLNDFFSGGGFASQLNRIADSVLSNPSNFVTNNTGFSFDNPGTIFDFML